MRTTWAKHHCNETVPSNIKYMWLESWNGEGDKKKFEVVIAGKCLNLMNTPNLKIQEAQGATDEIQRKSHLDTS